MSSHSLPLPPIPLILPSPTRFLFANHDGVTVELSVLPTTRVADVKQRLREAWPPALLTAERRRSLGRSSTSSSVQPRHHHQYNKEEEWSESEDEDEEEDEEDEDENDDGTVASCSGAGPLKLRAPDVDRLRLICMGQGLLRDGRTLQGRFWLWVVEGGGRMGGKRECGG